MDVSSDSRALSGVFSRKEYGIGGGGGGDGGTDFIGEVGRLSGGVSVIGEGMLLQPASTVESVVMRRWSF